MRRFWHGWPIVADFVFLFPGTKLGLCWKITIGFSRQTFELQLFSNGEERVKVFLINIGFSEIEEVNNCKKILRLNPSQVYQWMRMLVNFQKILEERASYCQDQFVSLNLFSILTSKGHIKKVFVIFETSKWSNGVLFEVIPLQAQFVRHCDFGYFFFKMTAWERDDNSSYLEWRLKGIRWAVFQILLRSIKFFEEFWSKFKTLQTTAGMQKLLQYLWQISKVFPRLDLSVQHTSILEANWKQYWTKLNNRGPTRLPGTPDKIELRVQN